MPALSSISTVGDKLIVGQVDTSFLSGTGRVSPGTAVLNGPVYCGATLQVGLARATVMIGPPLPGLSAPASLEVTGITNIVGTLNVFAISTFTGLTTKLGTTIKNALSLKNGVDLKNAINIGNGTSVDNAGAFVAGKLTVGGIVSAADVLSSAASLNATFKVATKAFTIAVSKKPFDILHPTKKDHRLRYVCLEGPAAEVYFRGRLTNNNKIEIPDYWKGLVDMETLGVQLTPIKMHQELYFDRIEWGQTIIIKNNNGSKIDCYYTITAERKDVAKNIPEYKGLTAEDYPGDNSEYKL